MKKNAAPKVSFGSRFLKAILYLIPGIYAATCIFPIVWLAYTSFKTNTEFSANILGLPRRLYLGNWEYTLQKLNISHYLFNTARITVIVILLTLVLSFINGYFIARFRFMFRRAIFGLYMCNLFVPVHAVMVPTYILFVKLGMNNHWWSTILPIVCMELTTSTFLVNGYVSSIPTEMEDAAAIDGSSFSRTLLTIVLPMVRPILVTIGIITFFHGWNEFAYGLVMFKNEVYYTVPLALQRFKGEYFTDYPRIMTTIFVCIIPALLLYIFFSKYIIQGMMTGAIKG